MNFALCTNETQMTEKEHVCDNELYQRMYQRMGENTLNFCAVRLAAYRWRYCSSNDSKHRKFPK